jgi:hypothetical protein
MEVGRRGWGEGRMKVGRRGCGEGRMKVGRRGCGREGGRERINKT